MFKFDLVDFLDIISAMNNSSNLSNTFSHELSSLISKYYSKDHIFSKEELHKILLFNNNLYNNLENQYIDNLNACLTSPLTTLHINSFPYMGRVSTLSFFLSQFNFNFDNTNINFFDTLALNSKTLYLNKEQISSLLGVKDFDLTHLSIQNSNVIYILNQYPINEIITDNAININFLKYTNFLNLTKEFTYLNYSDTEDIYSTEIKTSHLYSNIEYCINYIIDNNLQNQFLEEFPYLFAQYFKNIQPHHFTDLFKHNKISIEDSLSLNKHSFTQDVITSLVKFPLSNKSLISLCFDTIINDNMLENSFFIKENKHIVKSNSFINSHNWSDPYFWQSFFFDDFKSIEITDIPFESSFNELKFVSLPDVDDKQIRNLISPKFYEFIENETEENIYKTFVSNPDFIYPFFLIGNKYININGTSYEENMSFGNNDLAIKILNKDCINSKYFNIFNKILNEALFYKIYPSKSFLQILLLTGSLNNWSEMHTDLSKTKTIPQNKDLDFMLTPSFLKYYRGININAQFHFSSKDKTLDVRHVKKKI